MLTLKAEVEEGEVLAVVYDEAKLLCQSLNVNVEFEFNGKKCIVTPDGNMKRFCRKFNTDMMVIKE